MSGGPCFPPHVHMKIDLKLIQINVSSSGAGAAAKRQTVGPHHKVKCAGFALYPTWTT